MGVVPCQLSCRHHNVFFVGVVGMVCGDLVESLVEAVVAYIRSVLQLPGSVGLCAGVGRVAADGVFVAVVLVVG